MSPLPPLMNPSSNGLDGHATVAPHGSERPLPSIAPSGDSPSCAREAAARRGAPVLFDDEKRQFYCTLLRQGLPRAKAARLLGVAPRTVQKAIKNDPALALRVRQARLDCQSRAAAQIARAGDSSWRAAAWVLEQEKRRRGPRKPLTAWPLLNDPRLSGELKQLCRGVLLEVMPELRQQITARRRSASPLSVAAVGAVETYIANRNARVVAMAAEATALHQRGEPLDFGALWQKHLPHVPLRYTGSNAPQFPPPDPHQPFQTGGPQNLATNPTAPNPPIDAHFP